MKKLFILFYILICLQVHSQKSIISNNDSRCYDFIGYLKTKPVFYDQELNIQFIINNEDGNFIFKPTNIKVDKEYNQLLWIENDMFFYRYADNNLIIKSENRNDTLSFDVKRIDIIEDGFQFAIKEDTIFALITDGEEVEGMIIPSKVIMMYLLDNKYVKKELPIRAINLCAYNNQLIYLTEENNKYRLYRVRIGDWHNQHLILDNALLKGWFLVNNKEGFVYNMTEYDRNYYYVLVNIYNNSQVRLRKKELNEPPISTPPIYINGNYYQYKSGFLDFSLKRCQPYLLHYNIK